MTITHKHLLLAATVVGLALAAAEAEAKRIGGGRSSGASRPVAKQETKSTAKESTAKEKEEKGSGTTVNVRVRSGDSKPAQSTALTGTNSAAPQGGHSGVAAAAVAPQPDADELRRRNEDNLRRAEEAEQKRQAERKKRDERIAEWERHQAELKKKQEQERAERQARSRHLQDNGGCVFKAVMTDEEMARCRQTRR